MCVFGTRPEAIKFAPVIHAIQKNKDTEALVCVTAQHRKMLDEVLHVFDIKSDIDMDIMRPNQQLGQLTSRILMGLNGIIIENRPDWVLVQGDTTTTFTGALAAFYNKIPVGHIESGLRTNDKYAPFPEEVNRRLTTILADWHFAPTDWARNNLINENIPMNRVLVTGNTGIDAIRWMSNRIDNDSSLRDDLRLKFNFLDESDKIILVTAHRRESFGEPIKDIFLAVRELALMHPEIKIVFPVHLNPMVRTACDSVFNKDKPFNVCLIEPVDYPGMVYLIKKSLIVVTDSGGLQEESPFLGKKVLVLRNTTERPEAVDAGAAKLIGTSKKRIVKEVNHLLSDIENKSGTQDYRNIFGDGMASQRIIKALCS
jgi:UDP-N-acetylglucosamine 2-epimerase (non-hydrolysing)